MASIIEQAFGGTIPGLAKVMDLTWRRNEAISANVANSETPGYRAVDLDFAGELERSFKVPLGSALKTTAPGHLDIRGAQSSHVFHDLSGSTKPDGNNVDLDLQMGRLAANSGRFTGAATLLRKQLSIIRNAIRSGSN